MPLSRVAPSETTISIRVHRPRIDYEKLTSFESFAIPGESPLNLCETSFAHQFARTVLSTIIARPHNPKITYAQQIHVASHAIIRCAIMFYYFSTIQLAFESVLLAVPVFYFAQTSAHAMRVHLHCRHRTDNNQNQSR